jgi:hypothetical protein
VPGRVYAELVGGPLDGLLLRRAARKTLCGLSTSALRGSPAQAVARPPYEPEVAQQSVPQFALPLAVQKERGGGFVHESWFWLRFWGVVTARERAAAESDALGAGVR